MVIDMRMNLKNKKYRSFRVMRFNKIKITSKNLFIFLVSFSIIAIILGIIFYFFLNESDKSLAITNMSNYFSIADNYNYFNAITESFLENTFNVFLIWILGISVIGIVAVIFIYFCQMFSIGFFIASIFGKYGVKGILGTLAYLFPSNICYVVLFFILTFFAIKISYKFITLCFGKEEVNIKEEIRKYFKILLFSFIVMIAVVLLEVFVDPIVIKIFTKL